MSQRIIADILAERRRAESLYPGEDMSSDSLVPLEKLRQLAEEVGEVARAHRQFRFPQPGQKRNIREELIQLAASAMGWVQAIDRNGTEDGMPPPIPSDWEVAARVISRMMKTEYSSKETMLSILRIWGPGEAAVTDEEIAVIERLGLE